LTKLSKKHKTINIEKCCVGDTLEVLNNKMYNEHMLEGVASEYGKTNGCLVEIIKVQKISNHGFTSKRFEK